MQTIPLKAKVMVLPEFRYEYPDDDNHWTGTATVYYAAHNNYKVAFTDFAKDWFPAEQLRVLES